MKKTDQHIETLVEKTLTALDGVERAKPKPFLYTRIQARKDKAVVSPTGFVSPVIQHVGLAFIIMVIAFNIYTATTIFRNSLSTDSLQENEQAFVEDLYPSTPTIYSINQTTTNP